MPGDAGLSVRTGEYLFTQGVLGVACCLLIALCIYLERQRRAELERHRLELADLGYKHQVELMSERKFAREQQELRVVALQAGTDSQAKAIALTQMLFSKGAGGTGL